MSTIDNPPGQGQLAYRARTYAQSLAAMLANLHTFAIPGGPNAGSRPLARLTTRAADDPTIALLDAWAIVVDVLTFYQERIANEGYLRTATERLSLIELTSAIGYQLDPGLAATVALAFVVESAAGAPGAAVVRAGTQVQSVPVQSQLPQVFETTVDIQARAEWNALRPRQTLPQRLHAPGDVIESAGTLVLQGTSFALQPGAVLWVASQNKAVHVAQIAVDLVAGTTSVLLFGNESVQLAAPPPPPTKPAVVAPGFQSALTPAAVQQWVLGYPWSAPALDAFLLQVEWDPDAVAEILAALAAPAGGDTLTAFGQQAGLFGRTTPIVGTPPTVWQKQAPVDLLLERSIPGIVPGSTIVLVDTTPGTVIPPTGYTVSAVVEQLVATSSGPGTQVTGLAVAGAGSPAFPLAGTLAYVQSRPIPLAPTVPLSASDQQIGGPALTLDHLALGLEPAQLVAVTGQRLDTRVTQTEVLALASVAHAGGNTTLTFATPLQTTYDASTVTLNANVAPATHGQTVAREVLGSGDGSQQNQTFVLAKPNLTYVPVASSTASGTLGGADTLAVSVNDVLWREVPSLFGQDAQSRTYMIRTDDQGKTSVIFGDGQAGARVPTGQENVTAAYRTGLGPDGNVAAGALTLLFNRPLGVRSVQNPLPAAGGVAPQALDDARAAAPLTVRTLGRIVTLSDYQDFASDFPGVGKARATLLEEGGNAIAHLTVAADGGLPFADKDAANQFKLAIKTSIDALADPSQQSAVDLCTTRYFGVTATLVLEPGTIGDAVRAAATSALERTFGFAARSFAQSVHAAEVIVALQSVPGVLGVKLSPLAFLQGSGGGSVLVANPAGFDPTQLGGTVGADLILVSPTDINLT